MPNLLDYVMRAFNAGGPNSFDRNVDRVRASIEGLIGPERPEGAAGDMPPPTMLFGSRARIPGQIIRRSGHPSLLAPEMARFQWQQELWNFWQDAAAGTGKVPKEDWRRPRHSLPNPMLRPTWHGWMSYDPSSPLERWNQMQGIAPDTVSPVERWRAPRGRGQAPGESQVTENHFEFTFPQVTGDPFRDPEARQRLHEAIDRRMDEWARRLAPGATGF